ncbi:MAG: extracellular solute-binding protein [Nitrospirae bacterium]|nr:extracellular solute-binding protein [Nitrospirota bacterium]
MKKIVMKKTKKTSTTAAAYPWYTDQYLPVTLGYSILLLLLLPLLAGCVSKKEPSQDGVTTIVFKHGKIAGDPALFRKLIDRFEALNPDIKVKDETLPASTDEQHQFYVINLEGKSSDFDVLSMDVIWVPEFARTGQAG